MARHTSSIKSLGQGFAEHIRELKAPDYKESQVRLQYIDPFWELLGWDVKNSKQRPPHDVDVVVEPSMDAVGRGGAARAPRRVGIHCAGPARWTGRPSDGIMAL